MASLEVIDNQGRKPMILEARDIKKYYGGFCALDGVSLQVEEGEFVSIIGPNGAGKTTLINVLTGFLKPDAGWVKFEGRDIAGKSPEELTQLGIARSFQLVHVFPNLTVLQTLQVAVLSRLRRGNKWLSSLDSDKEVLEEALHVAELFGLSPFLSSKSAALPQGAKKLLDVASAFALRPKIILLDEPTSGVSTADKNRIMRTMVEAARQMGIRTILQVEHDMDIVFSFSDRIIAVHQGKIIADGAPKDLERAEDVICTVVGKKECFQTFRAILEARKAKEQ
jgi:branched-chain amino acid transport system ATP-binding protein